MRSWKRNGFPIVLILAGLASLAAGVGRAQGREIEAREVRPGESQTGASASLEEDVLQGALLYDNWFAALGIEPPPGEMPLWSRQDTNSRSGPDTWRCVECHGWDYRGAQGAYGSGSHFTGFPDVLSLSRSLEQSELIDHLRGSGDPGHDFSPYLEADSLGALAAFLKDGTIDDSLYIDPLSLRLIGSDAAHGRELYAGTCASCHGADGARIVFRSEGVNEALADVARRDPWRFLHRTRFGVAGTEMPVGARLGWTAADGRDVLAHARSLTSLQVPATPAPGVESSDPAGQVGGPPSTWWGGLLTGLGAFLAAAGYALAFIVGFLLIGFLVVTLLRRRR